MGEAVPEDGSPGDAARAGPRATSENSSVVGSVSDDTHSVSSRSRCKALDCHDDFDYKDFNGKCAYNSIGSPWSLLRPLPRLAGYSGRQSS
jgi:hypothetical protein